MSIAGNAFCSKHAKKTTRPSLHKLGCSIEIVWQIVHATFQCQRSASQTSKQAKHSRHKENPLRAATVHSHLPNQENTATVDLFLLHLNLVAACLKYYFISPSLNRFQGSVLCNTTSKHKDTKSQQMTFETG